MDQANRRRRRGGYFLSLVAILGMLLTSWIALAVPPPTDRAEQVVLLHGLGRTAFSMIVLEQRLKAVGYRVHNIEYSSLTSDFDTAVEDVAKQARGMVREGSKVHFVGHSLGGLVIRALLEKQRPKLMGRVVMLGTPNKGSPVIDALREHNATWMAGLSADKIGANFPKPDYEVGVIAGEHDPLVPIERARLEGMKDFLVVQTEHVWLRYDAGTAEQVVHFLQHGSFDHE